MGVKIFAMKKIITVYNFETIQNTLRKITESGLKCVPVVSKQNKLLGTISDGDIRRAILKKIKLTTKITKFFNQRPFFLNENPRFAWSICMELTPKSNSTPSTDSKPDDLAISASLLNRSLVKKNLDGNCFANTDAAEVTDGSRSIAITLLASDSSNILLYPPSPKVPSIQTPDKGFN